MSEGMPLSATPEQHPVLVGLAEVFEAHVVELAGGAEALAAARLTAAAGASLMAALDWMAGDAIARRPFHARLDGSCLEVSGWPRDLRGVRAAGEILSLVGGNLHPVTSPDARGLWRMRLPLAGGPSSYLMVEQDGVRMALPWTAVLAVVMATNEIIGKGRLGIPVLARPEPATEPPPEFPVVLLGHGLKRAYLAADRLIWRLRAEAVESDEVAPAPGLTRQVHADDGARYWLADPGALMQGVEPPPIPEQAFPLPPLPEPEPEPAPSEPEPPAFVEPVAAMLATPVAGNGVVTTPPEHSPAQSTDPGDLEAQAAAPAPHEPAAAEPPVEDTVVEPAVVEPAVPTTPDPPSPPRATRPVLRLTPENVEPLLVPEMRRPAAPPSRPSAPKKVTARHALVAEDSFIARVFLTRMLEQRGFRVSPASSAAEMIVELPRQRWDLVCVDVDLGDGGGVALLRYLREALARLAATDTRGRALLPPLVALVRDARDIGVARAAGVPLSLLKPFDPAEFSALLEGLDPHTEDRS